MSGERRKDWHYWKRGRKQYKKRFYGHEQDERYFMHYEDERRYGWIDQRRRNWRDNFAEGPHPYRRQGDMDYPDTWHRREVNNYPPRYSNSGYESANGNGRPYESASYSNNRNASPITSRNESNALHNESRNHTEERRRIDGAESYSVPKEENDRIEEYVSLEEIQDLSIVSPGEHIVHDSSSSREVLEYACIREAPEILPQNSIAQEYIAEHNDLGTFSGSFTAGSERMALGNEEAAADNLAHSIDSSMAMVIDEGMVDGTLSAPRMVIDTSNNSSGGVSVPVSSVHANIAEIFADRSSMITENASSTVDDSVEMAGNSMIIDAPFMNIVESEGVQDSNAMEDVLAYESESPNSTGNSATIEGENASVESAETSEDGYREENTPSIYTYLIAKYKVEQEEMRKIQKKSRKNEKAKEVSLDFEIEKWAKNKMLKLLGIDKEMIIESITTSDDRSRINEATIPERESSKLMCYIYNDSIRNIESKHRANSGVYMYKGDDELLRKAFAETGKDFRAIRANYLPWYTHKEIVKIYYKMKYKLRLKNWDGVLRDTRKIQDKEVVEIVERDWTQEEMDVFSNLNSELGKKWKEYLKYIKGKTENDIKIFYKYYKKHILKKKEDKLKKKEEKKEGSIEGWKVHERQTFALLFPHIGKNWGVLANYIVTKTATEIRSYHRLYYKNLRAGERVLEIYLKDIGDREIRTDPLPLAERAGHKQQHSRHAGVLFSCK
ncbi:hypothetical protein NEMIN01_0324 [Nematocida minor]|uniref:uncharacterized protein n=1 Tax=Nematocida minor TaxID=1912983 RepID=UPI00221FAD93|nr:uncharacterized protein NEMIN01_0324 [Nematocida minor]KAI5189158.1 hypothetical protein NEMIN01_0324 [Nematocida minor]